MEYKFSPSLLETSEIEVGDYIAYPDIGINNRWRVLYIVDTNNSIVAIDSDGNFWYKADSVPDLLKNFRVFKKVEPFEIDGEIMKFREVMNNA